MQLGNALNKLNEYDSQKKILYLQILIMEIFYKLKLSSRFII